VETQIEERRPECILMSNVKIQKLMRKTRRAEDKALNFTWLTSRKHRSSLRNFILERNLQQNKRENFMSLPYDDFPKLLQLVSSSFVSIQWEYFIETTGPMKRQRLNTLSTAERAELNRQLKRHNGGWFDSTHPQ
jgi:hypothetical protein